MTSNARVWQVDKYSQNSHINLVGVKNEDSLT